MARRIKKAQRRRIVRTSCKAAARAGAKDKASIGKVRIQTVAPWKRWLIGGFGLLLLGAALFLQKHSFGAAMFFYVFSAILILIGVFGKKKTIDEVLNGLDASLTDQILSKILDRIF